MSYALDFSKQAISDLKKHKKSGDKAMNRKIEQLLEELIDHPRMGTGKPEQLKHDLSGLYSRRITKKHRLVYRIDEGVVTVLVVSAYGHYDDK